jgi:hypothetical protein
VDYYSIFAAGFQVNDANEEFAAAKETPGSFYRPNQHGTNRRIMQKCFFQTRNAGERSAKCEQMIESKIFPTYRHSAVTLIMRLCALLLFLVMVLLVVICGCMQSPSP